MQLSIKDIQHCTMKVLLVLLAQSLAFLLQSQCYQADLSNSDCVTAVNLWSQCRSSRV